MDYFLQCMCFSNSFPYSVADAMEEHSERDADEFIAASWATLELGLLHAHEGRRPPSGRQSSHDYRS